MEDSPRGPSVPLTVTILLTLSVLGNLALGILLERRISELDALQLSSRRAPVLTPKVFDELLTGSPPTRGSSEAPNTLVLFSDFECPFCTRFAGQLNQLTPDQKRNLRLVFRQYPLPIHKSAMQEAELTTCAGRQNPDAFWDLYEFFYSKSRKATTLDNEISAVSMAHKLNRALLDTCVHKHQALDSVQHDLWLGNRFGVKGTPTMFLNGKRLTGEQPNLGVILNTMHPSDTNPN